MDIHSLIKELRAERELVLRAIHILEQLEDDRKRSFLSTDLLQQLERYMGKDGEPN